MRLSAPFRRLLRGAALPAMLIAVLAVSACAGGTGTEEAGPSSEQPTISTQQQPSTVTAAGTTSTIVEQPTTVITTPTDPTLVPPPPTTAEPAPEQGDCPYLSAAEVKDANGQNVGKIETIAVEPYPICIFHRPDGSVMAAIRIIAADTPEAAAAAVNQHVPIADSFAVAKPAGWTGGAMGNQSGIDGYPDAQSIYAVSKDTIAIVAVSNQKQSIKGRQMVTDIVANLGL